MDKLLVSAVLAVIAIAVTEATVCMDDSACSADQCCYIRPEFLVVSKRQLLLPQQQLHTKAKEGVCESYRSANEQCNMLETLNGHCGCPSGMSCQWVPDQTTPSTPIVRRRPPPHNEPGAYRCADTV